MMNKRYRVIHEYLSYSTGRAVVIPVGTIGEWFEQAKKYLFLVGDTNIPVGKWAVEAWDEFFERVEE